MTDDSLLVAKADFVALLTLNRPSAMNALSGNLRHALVRELASLDQDDSVRVIVLTGAGERAFCAGIDLNDLKTQPGIMASIVGDGTDDNLGDAFGRFSKPIIAAVNGLAITGGLELALCCDIILASSNAGFADTHAFVGALPGWGLSQRLSRAVGHMRAKELSLSGRRIDAQTALSWGLINRVVDPAELIHQASELAASIARVAPQMANDYKQLIDNGFKVSLAEGLKLERTQAQRGATGFTAPI